MKSAAVRAPAMKVVPALVILAVVTWLPSAVSASTEQTAITAGIWILIATSWNLVGGLANLYSFGQAAFVGMGAYTFAYLSIHTSMPFVVLLIASAAIGSLTSVLVIACFRTRGIYFSIMTLALAEGLRVLANQEFPGKSAGLSFSPRLDPLSHWPYWWTEVCVVVAIIVSLGVRRGKFGTGLFAVRGDIEAAEASGVNTLVIRVRITAVAAAIAGLAGGLLAATTMLVVPDTDFSTNYSIFPVLMVALGGLGSTVGPILGALLWTFLDQALRSSSPSGGAVSTFTYGIALVVLAVFLPTGLMGLWNRGVAVVRTRMLHISPQVRGAPGAEGEQ